MTQGKRVALSAAQRIELWSIWKAGQSLHTIGRAFGKPHNSIHGFLSQHGGIVPPVRRRSLLVLSAVEREDISRGLASGSSLRDIAKVLERAEKLWASRLVLSRNRCATISLPPSRNS